MGEALVKEKCANYRYDCSCMLPRRGVWASGVCCRHYPRHAAVATPMATPPLAPSPQQPPHEPSRSTHTRVARFSIFGINPHPVEFKSSCSTRNVGTQLPWADYSGETSPLTSFSWSSSRVHLRVYSRVASPPTSLIFATRASASAVGVV